MKLPSFLAVLLLAAAPGLATPPRAAFRPGTTLFTNPLLPTSVDSNLDPATLRRHYEQAAADKAAGEKFYKLLANYKDRDALVLGYKGVAEAIRARDASMFNKMTYIQDASKTFEEAVALDPKNPEIRFLRFSVESNLPGFLGLSKHVDEDKALVLQAMLKHPSSGLAPEVFRTVRAFLLDRDHVSEAEAQQLKKIAE